VKKDNGKSHIKKGTYLCFWVRISNLTIGMIF